MHPNPPVLPFHRVLHYPRQHPPAGHSRHRLHNLLVPAVQLQNLHQVVHLCLLVLHKVHQHQDLLLLVPVLQGRNLPQPVARLRVLSLLQLPNRRPQVPVHLNPHLGH